MGQVPVAGTPAHHLLVGSGKVSRHFARYFASLGPESGLSFEAWTTPREFPADFFRNFRATHLWILVSDRAIESVASRIRAGLVEFGKMTSEDSPRFLHASGATLVAGVQGAHPLMTFGDLLYDPESYRRIPFIVENLFDGSTAAEALGHLPNVALHLDPEKRALYHALVSSSGNFPAVLWADIFSRFEQELGFSRDLLAPFLFRTLANSLEFGEDALTGPLVRGDEATLRKHRTVLSGTPLAPLYSAFETFFKDRFHPRGSTHGQSEKIDGS